MATITAKIMEEKIKKGWTTEEFSRYFQLEPEQFLEQLKKNFSKKGCKNMLMRLERNDKLHYKHRKPRFVKMANMEVLKGESNKDKVVEEKLSEEEFVVEVELFEKENLMGQLSIDELLTGLCREKEELKKALTEDEKNFFEYKSRRKNIREILQKKQDKLVKMQNEIRKEQEEIIKLTDDYNEAAVRMKELNESMLQRNERLEEIEKQVKSLNKITIFVYQNGEIESENYEMVISDSWNQVFEDLMQKEEVEILTVKETKQLARVIELTKMLDEQNLEYEITFESENVQSVYEAIVIYLEH